ncbi:MAG TPA: hypothetical protein VM490_16495 [Armatimonadaceae bacterium]|nr:hypothetical protein [Armatimonadaceae bacterium]
MPILAVLRMATVALATIGIAVSVPGAPVSAAAMTADPGTRAPQNDARNRTEVRFTTRLVRAESASLEAKTADSEQVLAAPVLTTLDGQTASVNVTGTDPTYAISLSPTVEKPDEKGREKTEGGAPTLQVLWSVRLAGKTLPAGVSGVTMTGATRITANREEVIAEVLLPDPKTGRVTRFRLLGKATVGAAQEKKPDGT